MSIELGLEFFTRVFVVDAGREPNVIERQSAIGVSERVTLRFGLLLIDFDESDADRPLIRRLGPEINGNAVIVSDMTRSGDQDRAVGIARRDQALGHLSVPGPLHIHHRFHDFLGCVAAMSIAYISRHFSEYRFGRRTVET